MHRNKTRYKYPLFDMLVHRGLIVFFPIKFFNIN